MSSPRGSTENSIKGIPHRFLKPLRRISVVDLREHYSFIELDRTLLKYTRRAALETASPSKQHPRTRAAETHIVPLSNTPSQSGLAYATQFWPSKPSRCRISPQTHGDGQPYPRLRFTVDPAGSLPRPPPLQRQSVTPSHLQPRRLSQSLDNGPRLPLSQITVGTLVEPPPCAQEFQPSVFTITQTQRTENSRRVTQRSARLSSPYWSEASSMDTESLLNFWQQVEEDTPNCFADLEEEFVTNGPTEALVAQENAPEVQSGHNPAQVPPTQIPQTQAKKRPALADITPTAAAPNRYLSGVEITDHLLSLADRMTAECVAKSTARNDARGRRMAKVRQRSAPRRISATEPERPSRVWSAPSSAATAFAKPLGTQPAVKPYTSPTNRSNPLGVHKVAPGTNGPAASKGATVRPTKATPVRVLSRPAATQPANASLKRDSSFSGGVFTRGFPTRPCADPYRIQATHPPQYHTPATAIYSPNHLCSHPVVVPVLRPSAAEAHPRCATQTGLG